MLGKPNPVLLKSEMTNQTKDVVSQSMLTHTTIVITNLGLKPLVKSKYIDRDKWDWGLAEKLM